MGTIQSTLQLFRLDVDLTGAQPKTVARVVFAADVVGQQKTLTLTPAVAFFEVKPSEIPSVWKTRAIAAMDAALDPDAPGTLLGARVVVEIAPGPVYTPKACALFSAETASTLGDVGVAADEAPFVIQVSEIPGIWRVRAEAAVKEALKEI